MYIKLKYLNFSILYIKVKTTEILKYILPFSGEKYSQGRRRNYQAFGKVTKILPLCAIENW